MPQKRNHQEDVLDLPKLSLLPEAHVHEPKVSISPIHLIVVVVFEADVSYGGNAAPLREQDPSARRKSRQQIRPWKFVKKYRHETALHETAGNICLLS
jgi:hypothetical protein